MSGWPWLDVAVAFGVGVALGFFLASLCRAGRTDAAPLEGK